MTEAGDDRRPAQLADAFMRLMLRPRPAVPFVRTPRSVQTRVADMLTPADRVLDIGCGHATALVHWIGEVGCAGVGLEADALRAEAARAYVAGAGLSPRIDILTGDLTHEHSQRALTRRGITAAYMFLFPWAIDVVVPVLAAAMPDDGWIGSYAFCGAWGPHARSRRRVDGYRPDQPDVQLFVWRVADIKAALAEPG